MMSGAGEPPVRSIPQISVILPAYNEVGSIGETLRQAADYFTGRGLSYELIVVAEGDDGTRELVRELSRVDSRISILGSPERSGKGRAVRQAVALATGGIIGYIDADNKVPISEFQKIEAYLDSGNEVVIGSRALNPSLVERKQPWYRRLGSKGFYFFMKAVVGLPRVQDTQCGFKFFSRDAARRIFARQTVDGYMFDVEVLCLAQHLGYGVIEVPIRSRDDGDSRLGLFWGNVRNARDIFRIGIARRIKGEL